MADRVIFLDIDGPMIPSHQVLAHPRASWSRIFPDTTVAVLKYLCNKSGAQVVFNTYHNLENHPLLQKNVPSVDVALADAGFGRDHYHEYFKTVFPQDNGAYFSKAPSRMDAIQEWLNTHGPADWVCFDDECFTTDKRLILIDYDVGLTIPHARKALGLFGVESHVVA